MRPRTTTDKTRTRPAQVEADGERGRPETILEKDAILCVSNNFNFAQRRLTASPFSVRSLIATL